MVAVVMVVVGGKWGGGEKGPRTSIELINSINLINIIDIH